MDGGDWWDAVHGVAKSRTRLSDFTFIFHLHALEKEMATHSSVLAWRIPGMGEPGGLPSMGSHRVKTRLKRLSSSSSSKGLGSLLLLVTIFARASQVALVVKNLPPNAGDKRCGFDPWVRKIPWRQAWQSTPVFLPGDSHEQRSLVGYSS